MTAASIRPVSAAWRNSSRAPARSRTPSSPRSRAAAESNSACPSAIEARHVLRARPEPVQNQAEQVAPGAPEPAVPPPALGRGGRRSFEPLDPGSANPPDEVDILHQRQGPVAAGRVVEFAGDE